MAKRANPIAVSPENPNTTGECISRLLGMYGITQAELATELGLSPSTLTAVVRGKVDARLSTYRLIFGWFGLRHPIDDFEAALPLIVQAFPEVERRAAVVRQRRRTP